MLGPEVGEAVASLSQLRPAHLHFPNTSLPPSYSPFTSLAPPDLHAPDSFGSEPLGPAGMRPLS